MEYATLLFERLGAVARITLNRPDAANALDETVARELMQAAIRISEDRSIRAVILTGAGRMFCAGGDLKAFARQEARLPAHLKELAGVLHLAISRFARMEAPVIAAVNGAAGGAGLSLCLFADLVIAAESAKFTLAYTRAGLSPDGGSTFFLPRIVGVRRALELALTNRTLSAAEARDWGIVTRVVPDAELRTAVDALARELAAGPTLAIGGAKRLFHQSTWESLETQMELEAQAIAASGHTEDFREGVTAFANKQTPTFKGR